MIGRILIIIRKKGRGFWESVSLGTVKSVDSTGSLTLFDGRVFTPLSGGRFACREAGRRFTTHARFPWPFETIRDFEKMKTLVYDRFTSD